MLLVAVPAQRKRDVPFLSDRYSSSYVQTYSCVQRTFSRCLGTNSPETYQRREI